MNLRNPLAPRICDPVNFTCQTCRHPGIQNEPAKRNCDLIRFPNVHTLPTPGIILPMKTNQPSLMFQQLCILINIFNAAMSWKAFLQAGCQTHSHENCHVLCTFLFSVSHLTIDRMTQVGIHCLVRCQVRSYTITLVNIQKAIEHCHL